jgi:hypothetical protein
MCGGSLHDHSYDYSRKSKVKSTVPVSHLADPKEQGEEEEKEVEEEKAEEKEQEAEVKQPAARRRTAVHNDRVFA